MKKIISYIKERIAWRQLKDNIAPEEISEKELKKYKDGGSVSADLAMRIVLGDPKAIKELRGRIK